MEVLWKSGGAVTARDVCERLKGARARAYTTIMTTMDRLHRKGLLGREKEGNAWLYRPVHTKVEFTRNRANALASEILHSHGDTGLSAFVDAAAEVDDALLDRLAQLIVSRKKAAKR